MMAETHLQTSAELQNQSSAIQKELDNILQALQVPPAACRQSNLLTPSFVCCPLCMTKVSYSNAPVIMGPSMMQPNRTAAGQGLGPGSKQPVIPGMVSGTGGFSPGPGGFSPGPRSVPGSPVLLGRMSEADRC